MRTHSGELATAVTESGAIVGHARVVGDCVAQHGATAVTMAAAVPVMVAVAASYVQQQQLEKCLASIQASVDRIEQRLKDTENGVCSAADRFVLLLKGVRDSAVTAPYLHLEIAQHRQAVTALHDARHIYVERFLRKLEQQQTDRESGKGEVHPWVKLVAEESDDDQLIEELALYVRTLVLTTKLEIAAASVLAEEVAGSAAHRLVRSSAIEFA